MTHALSDLLHTMLTMQSSDLLILGDHSPKFRVDGDLKESENTQALSGDDVEALFTPFINETQLARWKSDRELDFALGLDERARFRINLYFQRGLPAAAIRQIPFEIPSPEALSLPVALIENIVKKPYGLILVTGATGSGKSTTLAAMIDRLNRSRPCHIVTIEDPIEYLHSPKQATFSQREIGTDSLSFNNALKYVLRQNPDVVLIGEMRDWETIQSAITVAETGHLVFATLHTNSAVQTIDRIIDVFPAAQQNQVRTQLSFILEAVIAQQLLKKTGGGRVPALEILLPNTAIRNLIREGKTHQIYAQMQVGQGESGMQTMSQSLAHLVNRGVTTLDNARAHASNIDEMMSWISADKRRG